VFLAEATDLSVAGGLLVAAAGAALIVFGLAVVGWIQLKRQKTAWQESKDELRQNLRALREAFTTYTREPTYAGDPY
jgi:hypothetical protein